MLIKKYRNFKFFILLPQIFLIVLILTHKPLYTATDFYVEKNQYYDLNHYRSNQIFSKMYFRNLIAYYYYDKKNHQNVLNFLKNQQPEFYWLASNLWENQNQSKTYNPALAIWIKFFSLEKIQRYDYKDLLQDCDYFGEIFCKWLSDMDFIYNNYYLPQNKLSNSDYSIILKRLEIYLTKSYFIPFMYYTAKWLPEYLRSIGLNLESAIIIKNMIYRQEENLQKLLTEELIYSIFLSGDPDYALKLYLSLGKDNIKFQSSYYNIFNILNLSKNYDYIINFLQEDKNFKEENLEGKKDIWTNFPLSKNFLKIRLIDFIYAKNKNLNEAVIFLERLSTNEELNDFEKLYARLIQARILYNSNIELAQKIAEDVQFKAQEKEYYLLEYYATIWNGWCLYKLKKYYQSNIEFTKAYNISNRHFPELSKYSVYLGLLLTKRMFNITDLNLIKELNQIHYLYIPDSFYFHRIEWIPDDIHYDIWKDIYIDYLYKNKNDLDLKEFILNQYFEPWWFEHSKNPGSSIGLYTSFLFCKYIRCNYNYNFFFKKESYLKYIKANQYILFYHTTKNYYAIINDKNNLNLIKQEKQLDNKKELIYQLKPYKDFIFYLNPHTDITHFDLSQYLEKKLKFALLYKIDNDFNLNTDSLNIQCNIDDSKKELVLPNQIEFVHDYPYLTKFRCDSRSYIRLWDLGRFFSNKKILYFYSIGDNPKLYQTLYFLAMNKNWYLVEILDKNNNIFIKFIY
jgi:hypothetical protein